MLKGGMSVDWEAYGRVYDMMTDHNPAYQDLLRRVERVVTGWRLKRGDHILDLGGGTGNAAIRVARASPECVVHMVDADWSMVERAKRKARQEGLTNVWCEVAKAEALEMTPEALAAVVTVNALYLMPEPEARVGAMLEWVRPGGWVLACDIGRPLNVGDWSRYLFSENLRRLGLVATLRAFYRGREIARQNRRIARAQRAGQVWTHSNEQYAEVFARAGFRVVEAERVYRGYADWVVAERPVV